MEAYKFKPEDDILEQLLKLNQELGDKEKQNQKVIGPEAVGDRPKDPRLLGLFG